MSKSLPARPNLEQLKNQAKDLLKSFQSGDPETLERIKDRRPEFARSSTAKSGKPRFTLTDAQRAIAREYGFANWAKLRAHVESVLAETEDPIELFKHAFHQDDAAQFRRLLERFPAIKARINDPVAAFDAPPITQVKSRDMLDVLLEAGADINAKSRWWAGGFGLLHGAEPDLAAYAIGRGAVVDVHAAARLGMLGRLRDLVTADPELVHARGGDGQTPLHFASSAEIAAFLLKNGANIDARDVDHESTPAQWMIRERQEVARYLVERGCKTDLLLAAALGDAALVNRQLEADPECIRMRVSDEYFAMINPRSGGTIYQWTLGWYVSAHDVAKNFGHREVLKLLIERSPADVKLSVAAWAGDQEAVQKLLRQNPGIVSELSAGDRRLVAHAARNNDLAAVRVMLEAGWAVNALSQHKATPLHWAGFNGNAEMAREILNHNPPLEVTDADFKSTPLGWAIYGSENGWYCRSGDYAGTVEAMLKAGAKIPENRGSGTAAVEEVLERVGTEGEHPNLNIQ